MKKRIVCLLMALLISATQIVSVGATREDQLRQEREETNNQLDATYSKIDSLQAEKEALDAEISQLDQDLVNVMINLNVLKKDIANKEDKIAETAKKLEKAEEKRDQQYDAMKTRIQYMYENPAGKAWMQILEADGLEDMLSKVEYTQKVYGADQNLLDDYNETVDKVTELGVQLEAEKAELEDMKAQQEEQQAALEAAISQKEAASEDYSNEIASAQAQADAYAALVEEQTAEIARLEEERIRAEEEARRRAEAEAAAAAAAAEAAAQAEANNTNTVETVDDSEDTYNTGSGEVQTDEYGNVIDSDNTVTDSYDAPSGGSSYSGAGQAVVDYATQFVGNPYVWGGTSLTNGADCSGFVQSVYAHFGVSLPRTSETQMYAGTAVSYSEAQPGDLICYGSHIAIYMGGGRIVHASNSAPYPAGGIKISDNAAYRTILAVRRVI